MTASRRLSALVWRAPRSKAERPLSRLRAAFTSALISWPQPRRIAVDMLAGRMLHREVRVPCGHPVVGGQRIGGHHGLRREVARGSHADGSGRVALYPSQRHPSAALDHGQDQGPARTAPGLHSGRAAAMALARRGACLDLVQLDLFLQDQMAIRHHGADAVTEMPGDLVGDPEHLAELASGDAFR